MTNKKDIAAIVAELIAKLTFTFEGKTSTPNGTNFVLTTCDTFWLTACNTRIYDIGGFNYSIVNVTLNESITVKPINHTTDPGDGATFTIPAPLFRHGTPGAINTELDKLKGETPFVWLFEVIREKFNGDPLSPIERETPVRLFIFDDARPEDWHTEDHYNNVIRPLRQFFDRLVSQVIAEPGLFDKLTSYEIINLPDWGQFNSSKGFVKKIFDKEWSGIELNTTLKIFKQQNCKDCN